MVSFLPLTFSPQGICMTIEVQSYSSKSANFPNTIKRETSSTFCRRMPTKSLRCRKSMRWLSSNPVPRRRHAYCVMPSIARTNCDSMFRSMYVRGLGGAERQCEGEIRHSRSVHSRVPRVHRQEPAVPKTHPDQERGRDPGRTPSPDHPVSRSTLHQRGTQRHDRQGEYIVLLEGARGRKSSSRDCGGTSTSQSSSSNEFGQPRRTGRLRGSLFGHPASIDGQPNHVLEPGPLPSVVFFPQPSQSTPDTTSFSMPFCP